MRHCSSLKNRRYYPPFPDAEKKWTSDPMDEKNDEKKEVKSGEQVARKVVMHGLAI